MSQRFEGRVAVVTGGASGIGEAIVRRVVAEGGSVGAGDVNVDRLNALARELGDRCVAVPTDVTYEQDLEALVAAAVAGYGRLDAAFNVAGAAKGGPIIELAEEDWEFTINLCAKGVVLAVKHQARQMIAQGSSGAIVNISSLNSEVPMFGGAPYCAAKSAAAMVTRVAAIEPAEHGIRVNTVSPGLTDTPLTSELSAVPGLREAYMDRIPMRRAAQPGDIAAAATFLATSDADYITGVNLFVDGGWAQSGYPDMKSYSLRAVAQVEPDDAHVVCSQRRTARTTGSCALRVDRHAGLGSQGGGSALVDMNDRTVGGVPIRVLMAKVGLDGHDRGVRIVARALRDAGMEVIYSGLHRSPDDIVRSAIEEDADVIGVSLLSGAHMTLFPKIINLMKAEGVFDRHILIGGGVMPDEDAEALLAMGVKAILGQETTPQTIVDTVRRLVADKVGAEGAQ